MLNDASAACLVGWCRTQWGPSGAQGSRARSWAQALPGWALLRARGGLSQCSFNVHLLYLARALIQCGAPPRTT